MVDIFGGSSSLGGRGRPGPVGPKGDRGPRGELPDNIKLVREVKKTSGLFKDYIEQIKNSIQLGFIPYRYEVHKSITMPCYMFVYE